MQLKGVQEGDKVESPSDDYKPIRRPFCCRLVPSRREEDDGGTLGFSSERKMREEGEGECGSECEGMLVAQKWQGWLGAWVLCLFLVGAS